MTLSNEIKIRTYTMNYALKNADLLSHLRRLTLHQFSGLNKELNNFQEIIKIRTVNAKAIIAYNNETPIAWALLSKEASEFKFANGVAYNAGYGVLFEVYVDIPFRRKGIASMLLKRAKLIHPGQRICVAPHDSKSYSFYEKNKRDYKYNFRQL